MEIVRQFAQFLSPLWQFFPATSSENSLTLQQYLNNQSLLLHGYELQDLKFVPKVHVHVQSPYNMYMYANNSAKLDTCVEQ